MHESHTARRSRPGRDGNSPNSRSLSLDIVVSCSNSWPTNTINGLEPGVRAKPWAHRPIPEARRQVNAGVPVQNHAHAAPPPRTLSDHALPHTYREGGDGLVRVDAELNHVQQVVVEHAALHTTTPTSCQHNTGRGTAAVHHWCNKPTPDTPQAYTTASGAWHARL